MKLNLMTYNLFEGAHQSYPQLISLIKVHDIDILCLQEVNGWQDNDFAILNDFSERCELPYHVFGDSNTEFKLVTLSRLPITSHSVNTNDFWHSLIQAKIGELEIFNLHLNPKWEGPRIEEVKKLLPLINMNKQAMLTGDFNSISRQDNYAPSLLKDLQSHGITKFGRDKLEYSVTDMLESVGLIDIAAKLGNTATTVPSAFNKDNNHEVPLRLDYMFGSQTLVHKVESVEVIKDSMTDAISDHYPLLMTLSV